jgi:DNA-binding LacI/PurR family transcriptional regulator
MMDGECMRVFDRENFAFNGASQLGMPKWLIVLEALRSRAKGRIEGETLGTVAEWKEEFDVSQATIDRALVELRREGVVESQRGKGIRVVRKEAVRHVGVFLGHDMFDPGTGDFPLLLVKALRSVAARYGQVLRYYLPSSDGNLLEDRVSAIRGDIRQRMVDGLVMWATNRAETIDLSIPVVGRLGEGRGVGHVVRLAYEDVARLGVAELVRKGCRRIALVRWGWEEFDNTLAVFNKAVEAAGVETRSKWQQVLHHSSATAFPELGAECFQAIWSAGGVKPDGIVSCDDYATAGILREMAKLGLGVGHDVKIASHANVGSDRWPGEAVIRIEFDAVKVAEALFSTLNSLIEGREVAGEVVVRPKLVEGCEMEGG